MAPLIFNIYISDLPTTISRKNACADNLAIMHADGEWKGCWARTGNARWIPPDLEAKAQRYKKVSAVFHLKHHASGKSDNVHLWDVPRFELLQNRMDTKDHMSSSIGIVITRRVQLSFWGGSVYTMQGGWAQGQGFPLWVLEGNEVGSLILSLCKLLVLSPLLHNRLMPCKRLHQFNRQLCKRPSRFETRSCFQAY